MKYFCHDSCGSVEFFDNEKDARKCADDALDAERGDAGDGWAEEVTQIFWGVVLGECEETLRRDRNEDDFGVDSAITEIADYGIVDSECELQADAKRYRFIRDKLTLKSGDGTAMFLRHWVFENVMDFNEAIDKEMERMGYYERMAEKLGREIANSESALFSHKDEP
jgi:hypothetical protein